MKKTIGIAACLLLGGCYNGAPSVDTGPDISTKWPRQDIAPVPWVRVVPSERTLALKDVSFTTIAEQIRYDINYAPHRNKFGKVRLILVDYTILPHEKSPLSSTPNAQDQTPPAPSVPSVPAQDQSQTPPTPSVPDKANAPATPMVVNNKDSSTQYESRPQRYVMTLSFYECDKLPPDAPIMEETIFMRTNKAAPQEAMRLMAHSIVEDLHVSNIKKLEVSLD